VASLAAPVFDQQGEVVAVIAALGSENIFDADWHGTVAEALRAETRTLSARLGYRRGEEEAVAASDADGLQITK
jgi:DNA-binding IclR family transcriptional regulator